ncbi:MAG: asparagine synthase (glutamine-hydrolyzing), partial [Pseudomonadales bacterium]
MAFVHRRLSIIDHEDGGQPMVSERGRNENEGLVAVVFNGCIYNHRELRNELESKGHHFVTDHSDTEVLIHGWREWKEKLIDHLEGMYAFAVWDREAASLYLARDPFGEKPLYVRETQTLLQDDSYEAPIVAFANEASSLWVMPAPNPVCGDSCRMQWLVPQLMFGYESLFFPGPDLIEIDPVSPGHGWRRHAAQPTSESEINCVDLHDRPANDDSLEELLDKAVASRLEADVPLGCFLSGGVDSSLIAHFAMQHKPDLLTFSVYMPDERYDESEHAEVVAKHLGSNHTTLEVSPNPSEDLVHLIDILGQPFGDSSILPTYWVSKAASEHVKVALSGDGGDELFIGYERYLAAPLLAR